MDHKTLPDGPATYLNTERPLLDNGNPLGQYQENQCDESTNKIGDPQPLEMEPNPGTFKPVQDFDKEDADCDYTGTCYDGKRRTSTCYLCN